MLKVSGPPADPESNWPTAREPQRGAPSPREPAAERRERERGPTHGLNTKPAQFHLQKQGNMVHSIREILIRK